MNWTSWRVFVQDAIKWRPSSGVVGRDNCGWRAFRFSQRGESRRERVSVSWKILHERSVSIQNVRMINDVSCSLITNNYTRAPGNSCSSWRMPICVATLIFADVSFFFRNLKEWFFIRFIRVMNANGYAFFGQVTFQIIKISANGKCRYTIAWYEYVGSKWYQIETSNESGILVFANPGDELICGMISVARAAKIRRY